MWAFGERQPLTLYSVRLTALRARRLRAAQTVPGFAPGKAIFPKAWASSTGNGGIAAAEQRWMDILREREAPPVPVDANGAGPSDPAAALAARRRRQFQADPPPAWLRDTFRADAPAPPIADPLPSDTPDSPPAVPEAEGIGRRVRARRDRAAAAAAGDAVVAPLAQQPPAAVPTPDHVDNAAPTAGGGSIARPAWLRLGNRTLPREARALAWRVLHVSLYTGVFHSYVTGRSAQHALCTAPACAATGALESAQHLFLDCPVVAPAADWLVRLWAAVSGGPPPPCTAAVLLADDHRAWQPTGGDEREALWTAMRLSWLQAVWTMRCRRAADAERFPGSAAGVVAATVAGVCQLIRRDHARTVGDARTMTATPSDWFRGPSVPRLTREEFLVRWGAGGVLCEFAEGNALGQGGGLVVRLTVGHPVALLPVPVEEPAVAP
jgi:hypothetical protein